MKILVLGSGGREHAFSWKIAQSNQCEALFVAPGNAGTAAIATNVNLGVNDFEGIAAFVKENAIDLGSDKENNARSIGRERKET